MQTLPYSALDQQQREQVAYLFADEIFGTDETAYLYEVDKNGSVTRRAGSSQSENTTKRATGVAVTTAQEVNVTDQIIRYARMNMDALAASAARNIYQQQFEEVHK